MLKKQVESSMAEPEKRPFAVEAVLGEASLTAVMETQFYLLSAQEYLNMFGQAHRAKDPKVPQVRVQNHLGETEVCFAFRKSDEFRTLKLTSSAGHSRQSQLLTLADHLHSKQAQHVWKHAAVQQQDATSVSDLLLKNSCVCTIEEYQSRLLKSQMPKVLGDEEASKIENLEKQEAEMTNEEFEAEAVLEAASLKPANAIFVSPPESKKRRHAQDKAGGGGKLCRTSSSRSLHAGSHLDDDDESVGGETDVASKRSGSTKKNQPGESPQEKVAYYLDKLSLQKLIDNDKLGVSVRHANECVKKLPTKERLTLSAHLKLAVLAQNLSVDNVGALTQEELTESVLAMQKVPGIVFPTALQRSLFHKMKVEKKAFTVSSGNPKVLQDYWESVRPYCDAEHKLDLLNIKLGAMHLQLHEKVELFNDSICTDYIVELILEGEPKSQVTIGLCEKLLALIEEDLMMSLPDVVVSTLFDIQVALRVVVSICSGEWASFEEAKEEIEAVKVADLKQPLLMTFQAALQQSGWYAKKFQAAVAALRTLHIHAKVLRDLEDFCHMEVQMTEQYFKDLDEKLKYLPTVASEIPNSILQQKVLPGLAAKVQETWGKFKEAATRGQEMVPTKFLQELLADATISLGGTDFSNIQEELGVFMLNVAGEQRITELMQIVSRCEEQYLEQGIFEVKLLTEVTEACKKCHGCALSAEHMAKLESVLQVMMVQCSRYIHEGDPKIFTEWVAWLQAMVPLVESDKGGKKNNGVVALHSLSKLQSQMMEFKLLGPSIEEQVQSEQCERIMGGIIRSLQFFQKKDMEAGELTKEIDVVVKAAEKLRCLVVSKLQESKLAVLASSMEAAKAWQGGLPDTPKWDAGLAWNASWTMVKARGDSALLSWTREQCQSFDSVVKNLEEVPGMSKPKIGSQRVWKYMQTLIFPRGVSEDKRKHKLGWSYGLWGIISNSRLWWA